MTKPCCDPKGPNIENLTLLIGLEDSNDFLACTFNDKSYSLLKTSPKDGKYLPASLREQNVSDPMDKAQNKK